VTAFEPLDRTVVGNIIGWSIVAAEPDLSLPQPLPQLLAGRLDPLLYSRIDLLSIDDTEAGQPFAVLSVKAMPSGDVFVYVEPQDAA
jgi:hypothetical protein